jgi:hypothetical protein
VGGAPPIRAANGGRTTLAETGQSYNVSGWTIIRLTIMSRGRKGRSTERMPISTLVAEIRDFINRPRKQAGLLTDAASWNTLCSALDVIRDTALALEAYLKMDALSVIGEKYLLVYGVLQVMEVQQDAVKFLCESLAIPYSRPQELSDIRAIRSDAIGHPMNRPEDKVIKSSFIQQFDLNQQEFTLLTVFSDKRQYRRRHVDIVRLLSIQRKALEEKLDDIVEKLRSDEMAHREKHQTELLQDIFPDTLGYLFSKIYEGSPLAELNLQEVKRMLARFREALVARDEWRKDSGAAYYVGLAEYPMEELERFFDPVLQSKLNGRDAYIFASFLQAQLDNYER